MHPQALLATFARFDEYNTGAITLQGLEALLHTAGYQGEVAQELNLNLDPHGSGRITCEAFVEYLTRPEQGEGITAEWLQDMQPTDRCTSLTTKFAAKPIDYAIQDAAEKQRSPPSRSRSPPSDREGLRLQ